MLWGAGCGVAPCPPPSPLCAFLIPSELLPECGQQTPVAGPDVR